MTKNGEYCIEDRLYSVRITKADGVYTVRIMANNVVLSEHEGSCMGEVCDHIRNELHERRNAKE